MIIRSMYILLFVLACQVHAGLEWESKSAKFKAKPGESFVEARFICRNTDDESIVIEKIKTACSCTSAKISRQTIAPGEQGVIVGLFNFGAREGIQRKRFEVFTSDGNRESLFLTIDIPRTYQVVPRRLSWTSSDNAAAKSCRMVNQTNVPIKIATAISSNPAFKAEIREIRPGFEYEIQVTPNDDGESNAIITIATKPPQGHEPRRYKIYAVRQ